MEAEAHMPQSPDPITAPPVPTAKSPFPWLVVILVILLAAAVAAAAYFYGQTKTSPVTTYADCLTAPGSLVQESYPATCVTKSGLSFIQPTPTPASGAIVRDEIGTEASPSPSPTLAPTLPSGWQTYQNSAYHFRFNHPSSYQVLTNSSDLYGWPDAIALLYNGGQSYDLAVEVWDSEADYQAKYPNMTNYQVFPMNDGRFLTLSNQNMESEVDDIIATFEFTP